MTGRKSVGLVGFAVALLLIGLHLSSSSEVAAVEKLEVGGVSIRLPPTVQAGEEFLVEVDGADPGQPVEVIVDAGYGRRRFVAEAEQLPVVVPPLQYPGSGVALVTVHSGRKVATATVTIEPGPAVSPIDLYLGPRTVVADEEHFSMLVAAPKDSIGNPVDNSTPVSFLVTRPSGATEREVSNTKGLLSSIIVYSSTATGRTRLAAEVDEATGPERSFLEVAGAPTSFSIDAIDPLPPADGQALIRLRTEVLTDAFDNELPDGTAVFLDAEGVTGTRRIQSVTIDAVAEFVLEVPEQPGVVTVVAFASGTMSKPTTLTFTTAVSELPIRTTNHPDGTLVEIGRVLSVRQSFVPDGTVAKVQAGEDVFAVPLELGRAELVIEQTRGNVSVEVLGTSATEQIDE